MGGPSINLVPQAEDLPFLTFRDGIVTHQCKRADEKDEVGFGGTTDRADESDREDKQAFRLTTAQMEVKPVFRPFRRFAQLRVYGGMIEFGKVDARRRPDFSQALQTRGSAADDGDAGGQGGF
jgi:hypothetical protein